MEAYLAEVRKMEKQFWGLVLQHVPRGTNQEADDIAKRASRQLPQEPGVFEEQLFKPSAAPSLSSTTQLREELPQPPATGTPACGPTSGACLLLALEPQEGCWTTEFKDYLMQGTLPEKEEDAERVAWQATTSTSKTVSYTGSGQMTFPYVASPGNRERNCWLTSTVEIADTTHHQGPSSARRFAAGYTGLWH